LLAGFSHEEKRAGDDDDIVGRCVGLSVGQSAEVTAAWVRFPQLTIAPLPQRYTRQSESGYRYESRSFATEIEVDELGVARRYAGVWEREAVSE